jgi:hypothetical protein
MIMGGTIIVIIYVVLNIGIIRVIPVTAFAILFLLVVVVVYNLVVLIIIFHSGVRSDGRIDMRIGMFRKFLVPRQQCCPN